jgi:hypothetical protein
MLDKVQVFPTTKIVIFVNFVVKLLHDPSLLGLCSKRNINANCGRHCKQES